MTLRSQSPTARLQALLAQAGGLVIPCCFDALSARLIERAGFPLTFMSGFTVSVCRIGAPDTGLISYGEMVDQGRNICTAVSIPVIGDGDTGYGNVMNVKRTVHGYAAAGFAGVTIEDQVWPKRCGHTRRCNVVPRAEAINRVRAAVDASKEGANILIIARTDARATHGLIEAIERAQAFRDVGADITFLEAPLTEDEMRDYCKAVTGPKLANMLEQGETPLLSPSRLEEIGYKLIVYPLTLMSAAVHAMQEALLALQSQQVTSRLSDFVDIQELAGFTHYDREAKRYDELPSQKDSPSS